MQVAFANLGEIQAEIPLLMEPTAAALQVMYFAGAVLFAVLFLCLVKKTWTIPWKISVFTILSLAVIFATLGLMGTTIERNLSSPTGGPVHWHADYRIVVCGTAYEILDPGSMLSNKVGTPILHEHNDNRIHIEGTPRALKEVSLGSFFRVIGGELSTDHLAFTDDQGALIEKTTGDLCTDTPGTLRVFIQKENIETGERTWSLESNAPEYVISGETLIPPGDRIYISFDGKSETEILQELTTTWQ